MPYLQLDTPFSHTPEQKRRFAKRLGEIFSVKMSSNINRLSVAIRELGEGGLWRCGDGPNDPRPAAILMCDIRKGRPAKQREELARELVEACMKILRLKDDQINLEFTQHDGDEMYHTLYRGLSDDWRAGAPDSLVQSYTKPAWRADRPAPTCAPPMRQPGSKRLLEGAQVQLLGPG